MNKLAPPSIRTDAVVKAAGSHRAIAELFGISTQAVHAWGEFVPPFRALQLKAAKPEWFKEKRK